MQPPRPAEWAEVVADDGFNAGARFEVEPGRFLGEASRDRIWQV